VGPEGQGPIKAQNAFADGLSDLQEKRYEEAIPEFLSALEQTPLLLTARYDLGVAFFAVNRFEEARQSFREVLRQDPSHHFAQYFLARIDLIQGNLQAAVTGFRAVSKEKPIADELYYLGEAYFRNGDTQNAIQTLQRASAWQPGDYRVYFLLGGIYQKLGLTSDAQAQIKLSENLRAAYRRTSRDIVECNNALVSLSRQAAVRRCQELLDGVDPTKLDTLGTLLAERRLYQEALGPLIRAVRFDPEDYEAQFNLGLTYFNMKNYPLARQPIQAASALRPESYSAVALLGSVLFALGDDYPAARELRHAHELRPEDQKVTALLFDELTIISRHLLATGKYLDCIAYSREALTLKPAATELHLQLAKAYAAMGETTKAREEAQASQRMP
jgi:tetratricopeptide (TPR) repeat protein